MRDFLIWHTYSQVQVLRMVTDSRTNNSRAVRNIERSVPLSWFDLVCYNEPHWACDFRASMAAHDELDALPDWLSRE